MAATHNKSCAVAFLLFWTHIANKLPIRYIFSPRCRHILLADELYCVGSFSAPSDAICEPTKLVGRRSAPLLFVFRILHELPIIKQLTSTFVHHYHCLVYFILQLDNMLRQTFQLFPATPGFDSGGVAGACSTSSSWC